jgi:hypothetical protein
MHASAVEYEGLLVRVAGEKFFGIVRQLVRHLGLLGAVISQRIGLYSASLV